MKMTKGKIIAIIVILAVLIAAFFFGGDFASKDGGETPMEGLQAELTDPSIEGETPLPPAQTAPENEEELPGSAEVLTEPIDPEDFPWPEDPEPEKAPEEPAKEKDRYQTDPVPEGKPAPVEPQDAVISQEELTCTITVRCDTLLTNLDKLDPEKVELVPEDGVILAEIQVPFYEGESAFNVLQREMKKNKIHLEFVNTPVYNSAYIEGIHNIYEFDCGELSGWMYQINGWFPNYGSSRYQLKDGDAIVYLYSCDLGRDIGADYLGGMQKDE